MLHKSARLTSPNDFARTTKSGLRVTTDHFVGYLYLQSESSATSARLGLVIGKRFGNSIARHRLARQIRHAIAIEKFPTNGMIVIRALATSTPAHQIDVIAEIAQMSEKLIARAEKLAVTQ